MLRKRLIAGIAMLLMALGAWAQTTTAISEIVISGNKNISKEAILAVMRTKVGQPYIQAQLDQDKDAIEKLGFFQAVDVRARPVEGSASNYKVTVEVSEFALIKEIRITGNANVATDLILKALPESVAAGKVYNLNSAPIAAAAIRKLYNEQGFFANVDQFGPMVDAPGTIHIALAELQVHSVNVEGATRTKPRVLKKLIKTRAGDAFNARKWEKDLVRIHNTQWFEEVKSKETMSEEGVGQVDLVVIVKEGRTGQFNIGFQVDPRSSFAGFVRVSENNFRGTGQDIGMTFMQATSGDGASVDLNYANPFIDSKDTAINVQLYSRLMYRFSGSIFGNSTPNTSFDRYTERRTGGSVAFTRPAGKDVFTSIGARFEDIVTSNLNTDTSNNFIQQDGRLATVTFAGTLNRRDVDLDPSRGDWLRASAEPGYSEITKVGGLFPDPTLLGSSFYLRGTLEYRRYMSSGPPRGRDLDAPRRVLAFRAKLGSVTGKIPFFEQFFVGGSDTVRGYDEDRFWGKNMLLTSVEYRHPIQKAFNAILFVDYGGAWGGYGGVNSFVQTNSPALHLGYGLGFSFRTPFGPIRLDFGFGEDGKSRTHFMIGTSF